MISETRAVTAAPAHIAHGSGGTTRRQPVRRALERFLAALRRVGDAGGPARRSRRARLEQKAVHRPPLAGEKFPVKRPVPQTLVPLGRGKILPLGQPLPHRMAPFGGELPKVSHELLDRPLLLRPGGPVDLAPLHQEVALSLPQLPPPFR